MKFKTLRNAALAALVFLLPSLAGAQDATFFKAYDIDATSYTYGTFAPWVKGYCTIETSGSSTTTTATAGCQTPFSSVGVGDEISVVISGLVTKRTVTAVASGVSLTVNSAWDITARDWEWHNFTSGTAATDGWTDVSRYGSFTVFVQLLTLVSDYVDVSIECRVQGSDLTTATQVDYGRLTSATALANGLVSPVGENCFEVRVGLKVGTDAGTDSVSAALEGK